MGRGARPQAWTTRRTKTRSRSGPKIIRGGRLHRRQAGCYVQYICPSRFLYVEITCNPGGITVIGHLMASHRAHPIGCNDALTPPSHGCAGPAAMCKLALAGREPSEPTIPPRITHYILDSAGRPCKGYEALCIDRWSCYLLTENLVAFDMVLYYTVGRNPRQ